MAAFDATAAASFDAHSAASGLAGDPGSNGNGMKPTMAISTGNSVNSTATTVIDYDNMPQWKKELIQRRKNSAKTILQSPITTTSANVLQQQQTPSERVSVASPNALSGASSSPPPSSSGHSHAQPSSPSLSSLSSVAATTTPVAAAAAAAAAAASTLTTTGLCTNTAPTIPPTHANGTPKQETLAFTPTAAADVLEQDTAQKMLCSPVPSQSYSRHGNGGTVGSVAADYNKVQDLKAYVTSASANTGGYHQQSTELVRFSNTLIDNNGVCSSSAVKKCDAISPNNQVICQKSVKSVNILDNNGVNHQKMVAVRDVGYTENSQRFEDSGGELKYGPGFVSKLRCRYLSLALRQNANGKQRLSLDNLRRATSLNNLLDDDNGCVDEDEDDVVADQKSWRNIEEIVPIVATDKTTSSHHHFLKSTNKKDTHIRAPRPVARGNDSLKRARSVEALLKYDNKQWERDQSTTISTIKAQTITKIAPSLAPAPKQIIDTSLESPTSENGYKDSNIQKPKRIAPLLDDKERPPQDMVKQTLRLFESTNNRRPRPTYKNGTVNEVASKVATFKATSPKKPPLRPRITPPLPANKPTTIPHSPPVNTPSAVSAKCVPPSIPCSVTIAPTEKLILRPSSPIRQQHIVPPSATSTPNAANDQSGLDVASSPITATRNDYSGDEYDCAKIKRISKSALENISRAGTTTQFKFTSGGGGTVGATSDFKFKTQSPLNGMSPKSSTMETGGKQIGVIRPLIAEPKPPVVVKSEPVAESVPTIGSNGTSEKPKPNLIIGIQSAAKVVTPPSAVATITATPPITTLTSREIEKNLINREKSEEAQNIKWTSPNPSPILAQTMPSVQPPQQSVSPAATASPVVLPKKKSWQQSDASQNTMVFNFSHRKDVPDYIENDGLIVRRKKELPKPGESGFVMLGDLTLETSTDPDDLSLIMGPPSPCNVEFENSGIIINERSNLRKKGKDTKFKIQFNDSLTSTYEYPSESSLLLHDSSTSALIDCRNEIIDNTQNNGSGTQKMFGSTPIGSTPLGSYIPLKASISNSSFELGVTRSAATAKPDLQQNMSSPTHNGCGNGVTGDSSIVATNASAINYGGPMEEISLQYLKPASDEQTVAWSEGTKAGDLLF